MSDNYVDQGSNTRIAGWHKVADPATGWFASKIAGWVADRFSSTPTDCLTVDFSAVVPVGTKAIRVVVYLAIVVANVFWRKGGDANIANTPNASQEYSHFVGLLAINERTSTEVWLSSTYTADFAVTDTNADLYIAHPVEYLL